MSFIHEYAIFNALLSCCFVIVSGGLKYITLPNGRKINPFSKAFLYIS